MQRDRGIVDFISEEMQMHERDSICVTVFLMRSRRKKSCTLNKTTILCSAIAGRLKEELPRGAIGVRRF